MPYACLAGAAWIWRACIEASGVRQRRRNVDVPEVSIDRSALVFESVRTVTGRARVGDRQIGRIRIPDRDVRGRVASTLVFARSTVRTVPSQPTATCD